VCHIYQCSKTYLIFIHLHSVVELSLSGIHYTSILWVILLFSDGTHTHTCAKRLTGEQVLDIMFALTSDTENSDTDQDDGAYEELNELRYNDIIRLF